MWGKGRGVIRRTGGSVSQQRSSCSVLALVTWVLIVSWVVFLWVALREGGGLWQNPTVVYVEKELTLAEQTLKKGLRGINMAVPVERLPPAAGEAAQQQHQPAGDAAEAGAMHVIFSTDCTPYQDWQTLVLFHSATVVGQKGPITRIASGCTPEKQVELTELYKKLYPRYHVHFTPDFKKDAKTGKSYDFYNKPWGLKDWLEKAQPAVPDHVIVALIDPDMIFLRPLTPFVKGVDNNIFNKHVPEQDVVPRVVRGRPVAQLYGLGAPWANDQHLKFNRTRICGQGSHCLDDSVAYGEQHYSVGPPYLVERGDLVRIAQTWTEFVPRVYEKYPYLLAEMYAYSMAAAHEQLPHLQGEHFMVSNTEVDPGEGWPWVDRLEDACAPPNAQGIYFPGQPLPTVMHYCQFFRAGELGFQKRRIPKKIFSCDHPMMAEPPADLASVNYRVKDDKRETLGPKQAKRHAFSLCVIHRSINAALMDYKRRMCGPGDTTSYEKTLNVNHNSNY